MMTAHVSFAFHLPCMNQIWFRLYKCRTFPAWHRITSKGHSKGQQFAGACFQRRFGRSWPERWTRWSPIRTPLGRSFCLASRRWLDVCRSIELLNINRKVILKAYFGRTWNKSSSDFFFSSISPAVAYEMRCRGWVGCSETKQTHVIYSAFQLLSISGHSFEKALHKVLILFEARNHFQIALHNLETRPIQQLVVPTFLDKKHETWGELVGREFRPEWDHVLFHYFVHHICTEK